MLHFCIISGRPTYYHQLFRHNCDHEKKGAAHTCWKLRNSHYKELVLHSKPNKAPNTMFDRDRDAVQHQDNIWCLMRKYIEHPHINSEDQSHITTTKAKQN